MPPTCVLIQPPLLLSSDFVDYPYHTDLGVVQAAACLRGENIPTRVVDAFALAESDVSAPEPRQIHLGAPASKVTAAVGEADIVVVHYLPFHAPPHRNPLLARLLAELRQELPRSTIVLADLYQGGQHYIEAVGSEILAAYPEADLLLKYEAEVTLPRLCRELLAGGLSGDRRVINGESPDIDAMPFPAWDLIDLDRRDGFFASVIRKVGRPRWPFPVDGRTLPALSSRGCPYDCLHCSSNPSTPPGAPKTQRRLSPPRLRSLCEVLVGEHGATRIHWLDEMVNVHPQHLDHVLAAVTAVDVPCEFPNGFRADTLSDEHLDVLATRVKTLSVSAESGVQRVVDTVVNKRLSLARIDEVAAKAAERRIPLMVHFIIGYPGESATDINATLEYALSLLVEHGAWPALQFATPLPGTRLHREAVLRGVNLPPQRDYGPLFQKTPIATSPELTVAELERFKWTFDLRLAAMARSPKLILNITYRCNNHCTFCAVGTRSAIDGDFANQKMILARHRDRGIRELDIDGGEPTLCEHLIPLVAQARHIGYERVHITTNGRRCAYEPYTKALLRARPTSMLFSLHGADAASHGHEVGVPEAFGQTIAGIRNVRALADEDVRLGINFTLTRANLGQLPAVAELAWRLGVPWLNIQFLTPFGRATTRIAADIRVAAKRAMEVIDRWRDRLQLQVINLPFCLMPGYEAFVAGDLLKARRTMVFVDNSGVNLADFLRSQRYYTDECDGCAHRIFCGGFYRMHDVPEPPWVVTPEQTRVPV